VLWLIASEELGSSGSLSKQDPDLFLLPLGSLPHVSLFLSKRLSKKRPRKRCTKEKLMNEN
jgi:hypothetical protein